MAKSIRKKKRNIEERHLAQCGICGVYHTGECAVC